MGAKQTFSFDLRVVQPKGCFNLRIVQGRGAVQPQDRAGPRGGSTSGSCRAEGRFNLGVVQGRGAATQGNNIYTEIK